MIKRTELHKQMLYIFQSLLFKIHYYDPFCVSFPFSKIVLTGILKIPTILASRPTRMCNEFHLILRDVFSWACRSLSG